MMQLYGDVTLPDDDGDSANDDGELYEEQEDEVVRRVY